MQRFDVFFYRSLKMYSTNIFIHFVTENLMFAVLRLNRGGVSSTSISGVEVPPPELSKVAHIPPTDENTGTCPHRLNSRTVVQIDRWNSRTVIQIEHCAARTVFPYRDTLGL